MSNETATLTKRLDRLAEVLTGTTLSQYAHTVYEASAELDGQAAQIAMLREALLVGWAQTMSYINVARAEKSKDEAIADLQIINAALNATAADVEAWQVARALSTTAAKAWERERRNAVISECWLKLNTLKRVNNQVDFVELYDALENLKETS